MKPITIIGGGIAGLALGIGLRQRSIPVILWEAGRFPRHRVCGEFISGRGQAVCHRLGLHQKITAAGARIAETAAFYGHGITSTMTLPQPAICYSRFRLDQLLADTFQDLGGDLKQNGRWTESAPEPGVVRATGRRAQVQINGWRWFALKAHASNLELRADLELHFFSQAYVGLCRIENGITNVCGLFRTRTSVPDLNKRWTEYLRGENASELNRRTEAAEFDATSFCSTAALTFRPCFRHEAGDFMIGDAFSAIAPLTGNGISMALESAELALDPLERFSRNRIEWDDARRMTIDRLTQAFAWRLRVAWWIQQSLFRPSLRRVLLPLFRRHTRLRGLLFDRTR